MVNTTKRKVFPLVPLASLSSIRKDTLPSWLVETSRKLGTRFELKIPLLPHVIFLGNHEDINEVYTAQPNFHRGNLTFAVQALIDKSLIVTEGEDWKPLRGQLNVPMGRKKIEGFDFEGLVVKVMEQQVPTWDKVNQKADVYRLTMSIVLDMIFGEGNWSPETIHNVYELFYTINYSLVEKMIGKRAAKLLMPKESGMLSKYRPVVMGLLQDAINKGLQGDEGQIKEIFLYGLMYYEHTPGNLKEYLTKQLPRGATKTTSEIQDLYEGINLQFTTELGIIWADYVKYLASNLSGLILGGYDTVATTVSFMLRTIAGNDKLQEIVRQESADRSLWGNLVGMPTLNKLAQATLLLFNPVSFNIRQSDEDHTLESGYTIPGGSVILLCPSLEAWNKAMSIGVDKFLLPDFFLDQNDEYYTSNGDIAFGNGIHRCIGETLAKRNIATIIPYMVQNYRLGVQAGRESWMPISESVMAIDQLCMEITKI